MKIHVILLLFLCLNLGCERAMQPFQDYAINEIQYSIGREINLPLDTMTPSLINYSCLINFLMK